MTTVGSLAYSIVANTQQFTAGVVASKSELRTLKDAFVASQTPVERFSMAIGHLESLAEKFPEKAGGIARTIAAMKAEMGGGSLLDKIGFNIDPANLAMKAGGAIFDTIKNSIGAVTGQVEKLNQLSHKSDLLGVPVRSLVGLSEAAEKLSGVDLPTFESAFTKVMQNVGEAAMNLESDSAKALNRIGLDPTKLSAMRGDEQFLTIADAIQKVENAGERLALSKTIAGKGGVELASMLAAGSAAIRGIAEEEIRASQIDFVSLDNIKDAHHAMDDLGDAINGIANVAASEFAPVIADVNQYLADAIGNGEGLRGTIDAIANATQSWLGGVVQVGETFGNIFDRVGKELPFIQEWFARLTMGNNYGVGEVIGATGRTRTGGDLTRFTDGPGGQTAIKSKESAEAARKAQEFRVMEIKAEIDLASAVEKANEKKIKNVQAINDAFTDMMNAVTKEIADKGREIRDNLKSPAEKMADEYRELSESYRLGGIDTTTYEKGLDEMRMKARDMAGQDAGAHTIGAVRGGSVEALRQQFSGTTTEKQLEQQKKIEENTRKSREVLERIVPELSAAIQLKEAL